MGGATGPGDDRPHAAAGGRFGEGEHLVGHAVGADHLRLVGDAEVLEHLHRLVHRRPIARRAHHDGDERGVGGMAVNLLASGCAELAAMQRNVLGGELVPCSLDPLTGFYRTGCCENHGDDPGMHVVCCRVTAEFLALRSGERQRPVDAGAASTASPGCARRPVVRVRRALGGGARRRASACPVVLESTHVSALEFVTLDDLRAHAVQG